MLHPSYFGPRMQQYLESKLYSDVEGTCSGQFGFIIAVVSISDIGKGMVISGNGQAEFITRYRAIVFKPFKGEVVDGVVHNVTRVRPFLMSLSQADPSAQMGIFAEVGPLNCFVSQQVRSAFLPLVSWPHFNTSHPRSRATPLRCSFPLVGSFSSSTRTSSLIRRRIHHPTHPKTR